MKLKFFLFSMLIGLASCKSESGGPKVPDKKDEDKSIDPLEAAATAAAAEAARTKTIEAEETKAPEDVNASKGSIKITSAHGNNLPVTIGRESIWTFRAKYDGTSGDDSDITLEAKISPNPTNLKIEGSGTNEIIIRWTPNQNEQQNFRTGQVSIEADDLTDTAEEQYSWNLNATGVGSSNGTGGSNYSKTSIFLSVLPSILSLITGGRLGGAAGYNNAFNGTGGVGTSPVGSNWMGNANNNQNNRNSFNTGNGTNSSSSNNIGNSFANTSQGNRYDINGNIDPNGNYDQNRRIITSSGNSSSQGSRYDINRNIDPNGSYDKDGRFIGDTETTRSGGYDPSGDVNR